MIEVLRPGLLTTVQDLGRAGWRHLGVALAGAADAEALATANQLVGNAPGAAGLEITLAGPTLRLTDARWVALTGAAADALCDSETIPNGRTVALPSGAILELHGLRGGARAWLAVSGGIDVPVVLGSRSTDVRGGFGGWQGRPLRTGDVLALGGAPWGLPALAQGFARTGHGWAAVPWSIATLDDAAPSPLRVVPGRHARRLRGDRLQDGSWTVASDSDRMGLRLDGPRLLLPDVGEQVSEPVLPGTIQVPPDGRPIVLGVDAQTVGGYPVVAHVIRADLGRLMQLRPGERASFVEVTLGEAAEAARERLRARGRQAEAIAARVGGALSKEARD